MVFQRRCGAAGILVLVAVLASFALAGDANRILYPNGLGLTFHYLDTIQVAYETDYDTPYMYLYCRDANGNRQGESSSGRQSPRPSSADFSLVEIVFYSPSDVKDKQNVLIQLQSNTQFTGSPCWFNLVPEQPSSLSTDIGVKSSEFDYVKQEDGKKTFSLSPTGSVTSSATTSQMASTATNGAQSTSPSASKPSDSKSNDSGLSTGAKAGIGIAVTLVGLAGVVAAIWIFTRRRSARLLKGQGHLSIYPEPSQASSLYITSPPPETAKEMSYYHELPHERQTYELDAAPAPTKI